MGFSIFLYKFQIFLSVVIDAFNIRFEASAVYECNMLKVATSRCLATGRIVLDMVFSQYLN